MKKENMATLALEDGTVYYGQAFGAKKDGYGEVCFNTSMSGYQEVLTDPSYAGQIVCMTYPHIGNVGVNKTDMESARSWVGGFVVRELTDMPSNFRSQQTLEAFLEKHEVSGIRGIDTRGLTRHLRDKGAKKGMILAGRISPAQAVKKVKASPSYVGTDWVSRVSTKKIYQWTEELKSGLPGTPPPETGLVDFGLKNRTGFKKSLRRYRVVAVDCGIKYNILRNLVSRGCDVTVVPAVTSAEEIMAMKPNGVFLSNGPGDPRALTYIVDTVKKLIGQVPIFGICLGHQMLTLALEGEMYKLKFGHRGGNQPVGDLATRKVEITSQNHGFAANIKSFKDKNVQIGHLSLNDQVCEGLVHKKEAVFSVQYHPEASPGPHDSNYLFGRFMELMRTKKALKI